jgi:predicted acyltransferase
MSGTATSLEPAAGPVSEPGGSSSGGGGQPAGTGLGRLRSLDAVRGLAVVVMLLTLSPAPSGDRIDQLIHPAWHGLRFVDLFFPLFLFATGLSMTLSRRVLDPRHLLRRVVLLTALGVGLASLKYEDLFLTGVLQHIAGSYLLAWGVLRFVPRRRQLAVVVGLVVSVWAAYVIAKWGADPWAQGDNLAYEVDRRLLGGYRTEGVIQTVMSTATVMGGAFAGRLLRETPDRERLVGWLLARAGGLLALSLVLLPMVPVNKRLWTPSFTTVTLATSFAFLALGIWWVDLRGARRSVAPLVHVGTNPIAVYVLFTATLALLHNYGEDLTPSLAPFGHPTLGFVVYATGWTVVWWLFAYLLHRRRIFIRV